MESVIEKPLSLDELASEIKEHLPSTLHNLAAEMELSGKITWVMASALRLSRQIGVSKFGGEAFFHNRAQSFDDILKYDEHRDKILSLISDGVFAESIVDDVLYDHRGRALDYICWEKEKKDFTPIDIARRHYTPQTLVLLMRNNGMNKEEIKQSIENAHVPETYQRYDKDLETFGIILLKDFKEFTSDLNIKSPDEAQTAINNYAFYSNTAYYIINAQVIEINPLGGEHIRKIFARNYSHIHKEFVEKIRKAPEFEEKDLILRSLGLTWVNMADSIAANCDYMREKCRDFSRIL